METTSTSFITGAGLKKCMPMTSCGRDVACAQAMIGRLDVVVARIAPGLQISSRFSKSVVLIARSSAIASTTMSAEARSSSDVEPVIRASTSALASSVARPRWICLSKFLVTAATTPSTLSWPRPITSTSYPALAKTSTMPLAIVPVPTTPTCWMSWRSSGFASADGVWSSATTTGLSGAS